MLAANKNQSPKRGSELIILPFSLQLQEGEIRFFMNVHKVVKVIEFDGMQSIPSPLGIFEYMIDFQNVSVPVIHLKKWLGQSMSSEITLRNDQAGKSLAGPRIIICELLGYIIGILVDRTFKIRRQSSLDILDAPALFPNIGQNFKNGMIRDDHGYCYLFDLEAFFEAHDIQIAESVEDSLEGPQLLKDKSILVVEDSRLYRQLLIKALTKHGAKVQTAENGQEGLAVLLAQNERFDAIISDIEMPIMSGIDMITAFRKASSNVPYVIFHSSISNDNLIHDIVDSELGDFIVKFDEQNIVQMLMDAIA